MKGRCDSQPERLAQRALPRELAEEDSAAPARAEGSQEQPARGGSHVPGSAPCLSRPLFIALTATRGGGTGSSPILQLGKLRLRGVNWLPAVTQTAQPIVQDQVLLDLGPPP